LLNLPSVASEGFQLKAVCVQKFLFDYFVQLRSNRHRPIAVSSDGILADSLLYLSGFSHCYTKSGSAE